MPKAKPTTDNDAVVNQSPSMFSPEWNGWVLGQLRDNERDAKGHPAVDGLRRLTEELLGPIVYSAPVFVEGANQNNGMRATVSYLVKIAWLNNPLEVREFGGAADAYSGNAEPEYARFPTAFAETRAEGRALRKALHLVKEVTAEEITSLPVTESGLDGFITETQIKGINSLCRSCDISVLAFIAMSKGKYTNIKHVSHRSAIAMQEYLNGFLQNLDSIPENLRGYDENWRSK